MILIIWCAYLFAVATVKSQFLTQTSVEYNVPVNSSFHGRIFNGISANEKQFPYQVGLQFYYLAEISWCGGSLISDRYILTAAHCIQITYGFHVFLGTVDIAAMKESGRLVIYVEQEKAKFTIHNKFKAPAMEYDIALIQLPKLVKFNDYIQPITLPTSNDDLQGVKAIASGWGRTCMKSEAPTSHLRYVENEIMKTSLCSRYYFKKMNTDIICFSTTGNKKATCYGDSGGPLVIHREGKPILVGITSFGFVNGCEAEFPCVFTKVSSYLDWIKKHVATK